MQRCPRRDVFLVGFLGKGISGAAWATVFAQVLAAAFLLGKIRTEVYEGGPMVGEGGEEGGGGVSLPSVGSMAALVGESAPFLAMKVLTCVKVFLMNYLSTMFGASVLAAHLVALTAWRVLILVGEPLSYAAQSFAPQYFAGDGEGATEGGALRGIYYVKLVLGIGSALSLAMLLVTRLGYLPLTSLFTLDAALHGKLGSILDQVTLSVCVFPILLSLEGSLLAIGRVRSLVGAMASNVGFMVAGWYLLVHRWDYSLRGVWTMFSGMHAFYALTMLALIGKVVRDVGGGGGDERNSNSSSSSG